MRSFLLLFLMVTIPLIIHLHYIDFPLEVLQHFQVTPHQPDVLNWWKNEVLYLTSIVLLCWKWRPIPFFKQCLGVYFGLVVVSSVLSKYPEICWFGMPNYMEGTLAIGAYCVLFLTAATVKMEVSRMQRPLAVCTWVMLLACALQYFDPHWFRWATHWIMFGNQPDFQWGMETWPLFGTLMNQNVLGTFSALVYAFFLARKKWLMTLVAVLLAVGSQSRGAWFAMVLATLYLGLKYRTWRLAIPLVFFGIGIGIVYLHPGGQGFKWSLGSSGRIYIWQNTISILEPSTFFYGYGPGAFALEFPQNDPVGKVAQGWKPQDVVDRPHNFYLQVLHASGGISLIALLVLFAGFLLESKEIAINAAVLSYLVNVFFTDSCTSVAPLFWIMLGTGVGRLKSLNKEKS